MTTFIDTSILVYLTKPDAQEHEEAKALFAECKKNGPIVLSDIVYSEFSSAMKSVDHTNETIADFSLERIGFTDDVLFRAGKAFRQYREKNNGPKLNVLPDFIIGAQVEAEEATLLTNNKKDFLGYFPNINIVSIK
ncbi:type II toxin-antitoxin system VapC family toxin [Mesorhizobium sp. B2-8-3]|uniref:type II toxin-antitoxin system VapC family toxin n=1 Tax=Mesorhizobium sp. B2-8-3 TaxID=2589905 RepID=UPI0011289AFD|nr:type II toxin-antitoxin system VapC family toxin [Mesorhizobium sp. B2-8-3]TPJ32452.1 type II toxin-antitoxin system VapC family toxin [Mesorhizobium sp. B2-8-3]